jgi:hypothetical protein
MEEFCRDNTAWTGGRARKIERGDLEIAVAEALH